MKSSYVYPYSADTARNDGMLDIYRESQKSNIACARAIEQSIKERFDGMHLGHDAAQTVIDHFGYDRVNWVLASTIQRLDWDGRFSHTNKDWAKEFYIPDAQQRRDAFTVSSHPAVLDGFVNQTRRAYNALGLITHEQCHSLTGENLAGRVLVLNPVRLNNEYKISQNQLVLGQNGFGCSSTASGRKVFGVYLVDGERSEHNRADFVGILKGEHLPEWAIEKLAELQPEPEQELEQEQSPNLQM